MRRPRPTGSQIALALLALAVSIAVFELGYQLGIDWLGPAVIVGAVATVEVYRRLRRTPAER